MSKCEKQVVTKLNKKLEKYGLTREELELKLHSASLYGSTVTKLAHCYNHDVATGKYDCPYADVVNNTICCTSTEKCYSVTQPEGIYPIHTLQHIIPTFNPTPYEDIAANLLANSLPDDKFPF